MMRGFFLFFFFFSSRRRHTRYWRDWSSDVCSSDLNLIAVQQNCIGLPLHPDLKLVPPLRRKSWLERQVLFRLSIYSPGFVHVRAIGCTRLVNLNLKAEVDSYIRSVVVTFAVKIRETDKHARIVVLLIT